MIEKVLVVCSGDEAKKFACHYPWAAISVATNTSQQYTLDHTNRNGWIHSYFADFRNENHSVTESSNGQPFSVEKAGKIINFVESMWDQVGLFMVHEENQPSRSAALVAAIARIFHGSGKDKWVFDNYSPNMLVYQTMLRARYHWR